MAGEETLTGVGLISGWDEGSAWKTGGDKNWETLDLLGNLRISEDAFGSDTPPVSPVVGHTYWTGTSPTGAWSGQANKLALYKAASTWRFYTPRFGWRAIYGGAFGNVDRRVKELRYLGGADWQELPPYKFSLTRFTPGTIADDGLICSFITPPGRNWWLANAVVQGRTAPSSSVSVKIGAEYRSGGTWVRNAMGSGTHAAGYSNYTLSNDFPNEATFYDGDLLSVWVDGLAYGLADVMVQIDMEPWT